MNARSFNVGMGRRLAGLALLLGLSLIASMPAARAQAKAPERQVSVMIYAPTNAVPEDVDSWLRSIVAFNDPESRKERIRVDCPVNRMGRTFTYGGPQQMDLFVSRRGGYRSFATVDLKDYRSPLVICTLAPGGMRAVAVDNSLQLAPAGSVQFLNFSGEPVQVKADGQTKTLEPNGRRFFSKLAPGQTTFQVSNDAGWQLSRSINVLPTHRVLGMLAAFEVDDRTYYKLYVSYARVPGAATRTAQPIPVKSPISTKLTVVYEDAEGSSPPELYYRDGPDYRRIQAWDERGVSPDTQVPGNSPLRLYAKSGQNDFKPAVTISFDPAWRDLLVFLTPDATASAAYRSTAVRRQPEHFYAGSLRLVNQTYFDMQFEVLGQQYALPPGQSLTLEMPDEPLTVGIALQPALKRKREFEPLSPITLRYPDKTDACTYVFSTTGRGNKITFARNHFYEPRPRRPEKQVAQGYAVQVINPDTPVGKAAPWTLVLDNRTTHTLPELAADSRHVMSVGKQTPGMITLRHQDKQIAQLRPSPSSQGVLLLPYHTNPKPAAMLLDDSPQAHPPGSLRIVNLTPHQAAYSIDGKVGRVSPRADTFVDLGDASGQIGYQIGVKGDAGWKMAAEDFLIVKNDDDYQAWLLIYESDGNGFNVLSKTNE